MRGTVSRELDSLVAIGEGTEFAFCTVGDADPTLDNAIITAFVSAFATDASAWKMRGTVTRKLDCFFAIEEGTEFAFCTVGDADPTLNDVVIAAIVSAFARVVVFFWGGISRSGGRVHSVKIFIM
jgi:hypothetical protein